MHRRLGSETIKLNFPWQKSHWDNTIVKSKSKNLSGNELTHNLSGNTRPQSSHLAESLRTDSCLKSGISVRNLTSTKKKKSACEKWIVKHSPQIPAREEKATTTVSMDLGLPHGGLPQLELSRRELHLLSPAKWAAVWQVSLFINFLPRVSIFGTQRSNGEVSYPLTVCVHENGTVGQRGCVDAKHCALKRMRRSLRLGCGRSSVGRVSDRHAADADSIPRCDKGCCADSLTVSVHPRVQSHALTSVRTLKIP